MTFFSARGTLSNVDSVTRNAFRDIVLIGGVANCATRGKRAFRPLLANTSRRYSCAMRVKKELSSYLSRRCLLLGGTAFFPDVKSMINLILQFVKFMYAHVRVFHANPHTQTANYSRLFSCRSLTGEKGRWRRDVHVDA